MADNTAFLERLYAIYGTDEAVELARLLGYRSSNAVRYWQQGKTVPGEAVLLRIKAEKGEDLTALARAGATAKSPSAQQMGVSKRKPDPMQPFIDAAASILHSKDPDARIGLMSNIDAFARKIGLPPLLPIRKVAGGSGP